MAALSLAVVPLAQAAPGGGKVVAGVAAITQSGTTTDIQQSSQNLSINWQSFNIAPQETVNFLQPSVSAIAVNRILGSDGSQILGHLNANGQVYLINPNGVVFGKGAEINVGGLVASTLDLNDASLPSGSRSFSSAAAASVVNQGSITAAPGGYVALLGNRVINQGLITATLGTVALGAGSAVTLTFSGNNLVHVQVARSVLNSLAENGGILRADGGRVVMTAGAKDAVLASAVNNSGVIEARTVENHDGQITLLAGASAGTVNVGGTLDASALEAGNGGHIETSGAHVEVADDARVTTVSSKGLYGSWLIDPQNFTVAASGGDISGAALSTELGSTSVTLESSSGHAAGSGNINVNDPVAWNKNTALTLIASNNVNINADITATGGTAGLVIDPNTANGSQPASGGGTFNLAPGASINLPNVAPTSRTALVIGGTPYTVINSLGKAGSTTGRDLQGINGNLSGHYALGSNIDATATGGWNSGAGFMPIGSASTEFTGTLDGLGHAVKNLTISRSTMSGVGLLEAIGSTSVVQDIRLIGGSVAGANDVGALVGTNYGGTISEAYSSARVSGATYVGGLVGYNLGSVRDSHATGNVRGANYVGGLVGFIDGNYRMIGAVGQSFATGNVSGSADVGGLVGGIGGGYGGTVSNSHATGNVSGAGNVGGLVGYNGGGSSADYGTGPIGTVGYIISSYATGRVRGTGQNAGGLVGFNAGTVLYSHATGSVSGARAVGGLIGNNGGPWQGDYRTGGQVGAVADSYAGGGVTGSTNVGGLVGLNGGATGFYGLVGTVIRSHASGSVRGSGNNVGGLVGYNYGSVSKSYATGNAAGATDVGGLVGYVTPANDPTGPGISIADSFARGNVTGTSNVGGLVGGAISSSIDGSYATGSVNATADHVGGLVGYSGYGCCGNPNAISNSYATGSVSGRNDVGGLVGYSAKNGASNVTISDSYSVGHVSGSNSVGGLVGYSAGGVSNSFWDVTTSGESTSAGGIGMSDAQMQQQANFTSATAANGNVDPGWNFTTTWVMYDGHTYPLLASFMTPLTVTANSGTMTYTGSAYGGAYGATYSVAVNRDLFGTLSYNAPQGAVNVGSYVLTPGGLYSDQQGYVIRYASGTLTIDQLASVAWTGGTSGNWSNAANWAGGAIPDYSNVAAVTIPAGVTVTYDKGVPGSTKLTTLTSSGNFVMGAGALSTTGNFSTRGYVQSGGKLDVGGVLSIVSGSSGVTLGDIVAGSLNVSSHAGAVTQLGSSAIDVTGASHLTADNGKNGTSDVRYSVTLDAANNDFGGAVVATGSSVTLDSAGALTATVDSTGAASLDSAGKLTVSGSVGTNLKTVTTGRSGATTFGNTTVGNNLVVTSTGSVTTVSPSTKLKVHGAGTHSYNSHVTVNNVVGKVIE